MTDHHARARVWTLYLAALVLVALTGPLAGSIAPLAAASSLSRHLLAVVLAVALVGASVALAVLLIVAVLRVVRPRLDGHRQPSWERRRSSLMWRSWPSNGLKTSRQNSASGPHIVAPCVALALQAWRYDGATFYTGKRGVGATMALLFTLGATPPVALAPWSL
jgi:hypothetical protein